MAGVSSGGIRGRWGDAQRRGRNWSFGRPVVSKLEFRHSACPNVTRTRMTTIPDEDYASVRYSIANAPSSSVSLSAWLDARVLPFPRLQPHGRSSLLRRENSAERRLVCVQNAGQQIAFRTLGCSMSRLIWRTPIPMGHVYKDYRDGADAARLVALGRAALLGGSRGWGQPAAGSHPVADSMS